MLIRTPLENRISRRDDSLLAQLAGREIDAMVNHSRQTTIKPPHAAMRSGNPKPTAMQDRRQAPGTAQGEPEAAQEVTFAEVLQELQSNLAPPPPDDAPPTWPRLNIQNAPPVVAKLLGIHTLDDETTPPARGN